MCPPVSVTSPVAGDLVWFERVNQGPLGTVLYGRKNSRGLCTCATDSKPLRCRSDEVMLGGISDNILRQRRCQNIRKTIS